MGVRLRFEVLGPLRCLADAHEVPLSTPRERTVLTILLLHAGEPVPAATLIDAVWGELLPRNARGQLQSSVWRLRKLFEDAGGSRKLIATDPIGYRVQVGPEDLDVLRFRRLRDEARAAATAGSVADANDHFRAALAEWRGPALTGFDNSAVRDQAVALDEEYVQALEDCIAIELERGRGDTLVPELTRYTRQYPYREKLHGDLMLALYRAGRQGDALAAYQRGRQLLQDNLGIEPGDDLQTLHKAILNHDPTLNLPRTPQTGGTPATFVPAQPQMLPADIPDFVGRTSEIDSIRTLLTHLTGTAVRVVAIAGSAGVGKTALSVHVAHHLRHDFPDGQLFANLHGIEVDEPSAPLEVLGRFLRALGVDRTTLPSTLDERVDLFRGLLSDRRTLVVLDNAGTADQVLPLVPGGAGCAVLVNSRTRLGHAIGADDIVLDVLDAHQTTDLLERIAGARRIQSEPEATVDLARLCGYLPLAIRVVAAKLATKPHWTVRKLVERLSDERKRLDQMTYGHLDVRSSIEMSYSGLTKDSELLLRRLGDINLHEINVWTAAALLDTTTADAEEVLEQLYDARLVDIAGRDPTGHARYRLHDLVRLLAREHAVADELAAELYACHARAAGAWLYFAEAVHRGVYGGDYMTISSPALRYTIETTVTQALTTAPLRRFDHERLSVVAMIRQSAQDGNASHCWGIAAATSSLFQMRYYYDDWTTVLQTALAATEQAEDGLGRAAILHQLGGLHADRRDYSTAMEHLRHAADLFERAGHQYGHAIVTVATAQVERLRNDLDAALRGYERALPAVRGDHGGEAYTLRGIGQVYMARGEDLRADAYLGQALQIARERGSRRSEAQALFWQGMLRLRREEHESARPLFAEALILTQALGDRPGEAQAMRGIGLCHKGQGDRQAAAAALSAALRLVQQPRPTSIETSIRRELADVVRRPDVRPVRASAGRDTVA